MRMCMTICISVSVSKTRRPSGNGIIVKSFIEEDGIVDAWDCCWWEPGGALFPELALQLTPPPTPLLILVSQKFHPWAPICFSQKKSQLWWIQKWAGWSSFPRASTASDTFSHPPTPYTFSPKNVTLSLNFFSLQKESQLWRIQKSFPSIPSRVEQFPRAGTAPDTFSPPPTPLLNSNPSLCPKKFTLQPQFVIQKVPQTVSLT